MHRTLAVVALLQLAGCAHHGVATPATNEADTSAQEALGRSLVEHLVQGEYAAADALFTDELRRALPIKGLESLWADTQRDMGAFLAIESTRVEPATKGCSVLVTCRFARGPRTFNVVLNMDGRISGLWSHAVMPVGRAYVRHLSQHDYDAAFALADAKMQEAAPTAKLAKIWTALETENGGFDRITSVKNDGDATVVAAFADRSVTLSVCVDALGKVCGFHILRASKRSGVDPPEPQLDFERQDGP